MAPVGNEGAAVSLRCSPVPRKSWLTIEIAAYAQEVAGTESDWDPDLASAGAEELRRALMEGEGHHAQRRRDRAATS